MESAFRLDKIELTQFKNHPDSKFEFHPNFNAIIGFNGTGKTNLLDAIYMLSFTKSYFSRNDFLSIKKGENGFRVSGQYFFSNEIHNVSLVLKENTKKEIIKNFSNVKKFADHIGTLPTIMITPDDINLINEGSEIRRVFVDKFISQIDFEYISTLIKYQKIIQQKNALLKDWHIKKDFNLLSIYNSQLATPNQILHQKRHQYLSLLIQYSVEYYNFLSNHSYPIQLRYSSQLNEKKWNELVSLFDEKEQKMQRTFIGVHKDDLLFELNENLFKEIASQGQKKSLLFALKIAEARIILEKKKISPIILLDDIFEKLDDSRLERLFNLILNFNPIQVFITDVNEQRVIQKLANHVESYKIIRL